VLCKAYFGVWLSMPINVGSAFVSSTLLTICQPPVFVRCSKESESMAIGSEGADGVLVCSSSCAELVPRVRPGRVLRTLCRIRPHSLSFMRYALVLRHVRMCKIVLRQSLRSYEFILPFHQLLDLLQRLLLVERQLFDLILHSVPIFRHVGVCADGVNQRSGPVTLRVLYGELRNCPFLQYHRR
jgi:hypothetical protein